MLKVDLTHLDSFLKKILNIKKILAIHCYTTQLHLAICIANGFDFGNLNSDLCSYFKEMLP